MGRLGGLRYEKPTFSVTGSGYYGKGIGTTFFGAEGVRTVLPATGSDNARKSFGFIGQVTVTPAGSKVTITGSWGASYLKEQRQGEGPDFKHR